MIKNIDEAIAKAEKQLIKLKEEKETQRRKKLLPIGEAALTVFPELENIKTKKELIDFFSNLTHNNYSNFVNYEDNL